MSDLDAIVYDCEIKNCIPTGDRLDNIMSQLRFCKGWDDFAGMGISCICVYDYGEGMFRIFLHDNLDDFAALAARREYVIGYNSSTFDDKLCEAHGIKVQTTFDLYHEIKIAAGYKPGARIRGYKLAEVAQINLEKGKYAEGDQAPVLWQQRKPGTVIDYCMRDVQLTKMLFDRKQELIDPVTHKPLTTRSLFEAKHGSQQTRLAL